MTLHVVPLLQPVPILLLLPLHLQQRGSPKLCADGYSRLQQGTSVVI